MSSRPYYHSIIGQPGKLCRSGFNFKIPAHCGCIHTKKYDFTMRLPSLVSVVAGFSLLQISFGNPFSKPYIPFRTDPFDQPIVVDHEIDLENVSVLNFRSRIQSLESNMENKHCPLQFVLGVSKRMHGVSQQQSSSEIHQAPVIYPVFTAQGPGRQVVYATQYEHLDLLTPGTIESGGGKSNNDSNKNKIKKLNYNNGGVKEILVQAPDFPLLLEGSTFHTSPILHDVNADGRMDAIIADYDGGIFIVGLTTSNAVDGHGRTRLFQSAQVPRLYLRRDWMEARVDESLGILPPNTLPPHPSVNITNNTRYRPQQNIHDPYHSYFELYSSNSISNDKGLLRAVTDNVLGQDASQRQAVQERRRQQHLQYKQVHVTEHGTLLHDSGEADLSGGSVNQTSSGLQNDEHARMFDDFTDEAQRDHATDDLAWEQAMQRRKELYGGEEEGIAGHAELSKDEERHLQEAANHERGVENNHRRLQEAQDQQAQEHGGLASQGAGSDPAQQHVVEGNMQNAEQAISEVASQEQHQVQDAVHLQEHQTASHESNAEQGLAEVHQQTHDSVQDHQNGFENQHEKQIDNNEQARVDPLEGLQNIRMQQQDLVGNELGSVGGEPKQEFRHDTIDTIKKDNPPVQEQGGMYDDLINQPDRGQPARDVQYDDYGIDDPNPYSGEHHGKPASNDHNIDYHDDYARYGRGHYDDYYRFHNSAHQEYYDSKNYIRISPHVLATPTLAELPKLYSNNDEKDEILFVPVSYYLDEDEYEGYFSYQRFSEKDHGDETEVDRGKYVASAILTYILGDNPRWSSEQHLDLSSDYSAPENATVVGGLSEREDITRMGAFALASPTVADIDGDGKLEVLIGTSLGMVYCLDARTLQKKDKWPLQMRYPVESRVVVEDLVGDTNLEVLIADVGGSIACFDHEGKKLWHRNLATSIGKSSHDVTGMSSMVLGDVNG
jgi:hypothetical protein